jgi:hypothetical protein
LLTIDYFLKKRGLRAPWVATVDLQDGGVCRLMQVMREVKHNQLLAALGEGAFSSEDDELVG